VGNVIRIFTALRFLAWPVMIVLAWFTGRRGAKRDAALKDAREYQQTMERMADVEMGDGGPATRERMRERGNKR
jgi:hypothetical protein